MKTHGTAPRGHKPQPLSPLHEGRFGRLFRKLPPAPPLDQGQLEQLAESMRESDPAGGGGQPPGGWGGSGPPPAPPDLDNTDIPAGYTYFGQFVDHDITFDPASSLQGQNDPDALIDFRTPRFDLDSVYGSGPDDEPFQYVKEAGGRLLVGSSNDQEDLPRNDQGIALIGDPRNDENIVVSQLQLVFLKLHNKLLDAVSAEAEVPAAGRFEAAQQRTRWHYQWVVVHDFLRRLVGAELVNQLFAPDETSGDLEFHLRYYRPKKNAYMPVEFSVAAYRFGHSQVRPAYDLNGTVTGIPIFIPGDQVGELDDLRGFRPLPGGWAIEWPKFLEIDGSVPQASRRIDAKLVSGLFDLPGVPANEPQSLALRNLIRGQSFELPSGQDVARHLRANPVLGGDDLGAPEPTPLWFYILKEAELAGGTRLGPVGGRIVAEVILGLLRADPKSWVNQEPDWRPTIPTAAGAPEQLQLGDLVKFATT